MSHRSPGPGRCRVMGSRFNVPSLCRTAFAARTLRSWTPGLTSRRSPARCLLHACGAMDSRFNVPSVTRTAFAARRLRSWTPGLTSRRSPGQCRVTIIMYSRYNVPSVTRTAFAARRLRSWTPGLTSRPSRRRCLLHACRVMGSNVPSVTRTRTMQSYGLPVNVPSLCRTAFAACRLCSWTPGSMSRRSPGRCLLHACGVMDSRFNVPSVTRTALAARMPRSICPPSKVPFLGPKGRLHPQWAGPDCRCSPTASACCWKLWPPSRPERGHAHLRRRAWLDGSTCSIAGSPPAPMCAAAQSLCEEHLHLVCVSCRLSFGRHFAPCVGHLFGRLMAVRFRYWTPSPLSILPTKVLFSHPGSLVSPDKGSLDVQSRGYPRNGPGWGEFHVKNQEWECSNLSCQLQSQP